MKKVLKIGGIVLVTLLVLLTIGAIYFNSAYPDVEPAPNLKVENTPDRLSRGEYLANHVTVCIDCHSERDWTKFSGPVISGTEGKGGEVFDEKIGVPGKIYVKNITPAALHNWTDGEILRAMTCGVNNKDEALFPIMPYFNYANLSEEDAYSIITYIRTLKPIEGSYPDKELDFPLNMIVKTLPIKTYAPKPVVDRSNAVGYGKYLVSISGCGECHTQSIEGEPVKGMEFAGGSEFKLPFGTIRTANISPDTETGIGSWDKDLFVKRFKAFDPEHNDYMSVKAGEFNTVMPWTMYAGMTEEDLGAIYDYLRTVKPVKNQVVRFTPPNN